MSGHPRDRRILVIINPAAGVISKDVAASIIFKKLRKHYRTVAIINSNSPDNGAAIAREAVGQFDVITAFGGDGTINSIAAALVGAPAVLGVLPGGSGNGLVRNLNIPVAWRRALDVLVEGEDRTYDVGRINDKLFFNVAGVGLDAQISRRFNLESKSRGLTAYTYYTIKSLMKKPTFRVTLTYDDQTIQQEVLLIAFANFKQYGGKFVIAPFAEADDGLIDICILKEFKILKNTLNLQKIFTGHIHQFPFYQTFQCRSCRLETPDGVVPFHFDGEYGGRDLNRYHIETLQGKIQIRTPKRK